MQILSGIVTQKNANCQPCYIDVQTRNCTELSGLCICKLHITYMLAYENLYCTYMHVFVLILAARVLINAVVSCIQTKWSLQTLSGCKVK